MTKRKTAPAATPAGVDLTSPEAYEQALQDLNITVPVIQCRLLNNRLEFRLYGGRVLYWPEEDKHAD